MGKTRMGSIGVIGAALTFIVATAPHAMAKDSQTKNGPAPNAVDAIAACRDIADPARRLACYDEKVAALAAAQSAQEIVVVDEQQMAAAERGLFGFGDRAVAQALPGKKADLDEITATIAQARRRGDGAWMLTLDDGARWVQVDDRQPVYDPKPGMTVRIRKAALGTFMASVDGARAFRVRREQ